MENITIQEMARIDPTDQAENKSKYLPPLFGIPISIKDVFHF